MNNHNALKTFNRTNCIILGDEVKSILMKGCGISERDNDQLTPRQVALNKGLDDVVEEIGMTNH